jgi:multiple sugar transport system substrate-binding protein
MGLAYNIGMLDEAGYNAPPKTWDELAAMAQKLTDRDNDIAGFSMITDGSNATSWHMTTMAYTFGLKNTDIVTVEGGRYKANFGSNSALVDALRFLKDLRWKYDVLPPEDMDWAANGEALVTGRAAMVVMAGDQFTWIRPTFPDADLSQYGFAPLPSGGSGKSVSLVGGIMNMVSASATPDQIEAVVYYNLWSQLEDNPMKVFARSPSLPFFIGPHQEAIFAMEKQYASLPVDNYQLFRDAIVSGATGIMAEPPIACEEFYMALAPEISEILNDQAADPAALVQNAARTYQTYLDYLTVEW